MFSLTLTAALPDSTIHPFQTRSCPLMFFAVLRLIFNKSKTASKLCIVDKSDVSLEIASLRPTLTNENRQSQIRLEFHQYFDF